MRHLSTIIGTFWLLLLCVPTTTAYAQTNGTIRGSVIDAATGEPFYGATVVLEGTSNGDLTDFDGKFEINTAPGIHALRISFISYKTITITDIEVVAGKVILLENINMSEDVETLEEVVVTATAVRNTEAALLVLKRNSTMVIDGISSANFRKIGDSDAAAAVKRVPGVSIEGGKYVYVRGLGDRYTKTILNGMDIPGLDPDRNSIQMDIFPTNLIENIIVIKSFNGDLPADFTGGVVNINTKEFPEERVASVSFSGSYNPSMHFNNNFLTYEGSSTDFLGFDNGLRRIPTDGLNSNEIPLYPQVVGRPNSQESANYQDILGRFNTNLAAIQQNSGMNLGIGLSFGNQHNIGTRKLGYFASLSYDRSSEFYQDVVYARYGKSSPEVFQLEEREFQRGSFGTISNQLSGMAGISVKGENSKYTLNLLHIQNGESKAALFDYENNDLGAVFSADQHNLEYSQRSLTNLLLGGTHYTENKRWKIEWKLSPTLSRLDDPDIRFTRIRKDGGNFTIGTESGNPERIWRFLTETSLSGKLDINRNINLFDRDSKIKFGSAYTYKERDYSIQGFQVIPFRVDISSGDPNVILSDENRWPSNEAGTQGTRFEPNFVPVNTNEFLANTRNLAAYISHEMNPSARAKVVLGLRGEYYQQFYSGQNQQGLVLSDERVLNDFDLFPAANLIFNLSEKQNLRLSYSKTIARPSFKEASFAEILDPITSRTFIGGFFPDVNSAGEIIWDGNLVATRINNFDLRWETFGERGQTLSLSAFYKAFVDPIEIVQYVQTPNNFQPRNVGDGRVLGVELEMRKTLDFISDGLENFTFSSNLTVTQSSIDMSPTEFQSRVLNARVGQTIEATRDMAGQAPYIINAGLAYNNSDNTLDMGLFYNVQGKTLSFVGIADRPDVYTVPFNSLNFALNKKFGESKRIAAGFKAGNILNAKREFVFEAFNSTDELFTSLKPGAIFSLSLNYSF